jgi:DNA-directed RNA polymerase subunit RPC12/RpoP
MREYTKCLNCGAIFPSEIEVQGDPNTCPVCGNEGLASIETDVEQVINEHDGML